MYKRKSSSTAARSLRRLFWVTQLACVSAWGEEIKFDQSFIQNFGGSLSVDASQFGKSTLPAGRYDFDLVIDNSVFANRAIELLIQSDKPQLCFRRADLPEFEDLLPADTTGCIDIEKAIPGARISFDLLRLRVDFHIPARLLDKIDRTKLRKYYDRGIDTLLVNYNLTGAMGGGIRSINADAQLGLNWGDWRLRSNLAASSYNGNVSSSQGNSLRTFYAYRQIEKWNGQLVLGNTTSGGSMLGSAPLFGARFYTDPDMLPVQPTGVVPVVQGIARTNAVVKISQNGRLLSTRNVAPGAFSIDDLPVLLGTQNLDIRIEESDGTTHQYSQAVSVLPTMRAEGTAVYSFAAGSAVTANDFHAAQCTASYGLAGGTTLTGELTIGNLYSAAAAGIAYDLGNFGAVSVDVAQSRFKDDTFSETGHAVRVLWTKSLQATGTNIQLIGARHATDGFLDINDALLLHTLPAGQAPFLVRDWYQAQVNQQLNDLSNLNFNFSRRTAWNSSAVEQTIGAGFSRRFGSVGVSLGYSMTRSELTPTRTQWSLDLSLPLGWSSGTSASIRTTHDSLAGNSTQLVANGAINETNTWHYNLTAGTGNQTTLNGSAYYSGPYAQANIGMSSAQGRQQFTGGMAGAVAVHSEGITFGQPTGESAALVNAGGLKGVGVFGNNGISSDSKGYLLIPNIAAYRENQLLLDITRSEQAETASFEQDSMKVVPVRGALVKVNYAASTGQPVLFTVRMENGDHAPMGARISGFNKHDSYIGLWGMSYVLASRQEGEATLKWSDQSCRFKYKLDPSKSLQKKEVRCER